MRNLSNGFDIYLVMMSPGKKADINNSNNSTIVLDPSLPTPRGSHAILAQQTDQEVLEFLNFLINLLILHGYLLELARTDPIQL